MNIIRREKYLSKVSPYIGKDLIKVLIGSRRVGKTYIMLQIMDDINKNDEAANIIYINKEQYEFKSISNDEQLYQYVIEHLKNKKNNYLFVDEVQEIERFELALRQLLLKNIDIYCTGSNARMLSSDLATHLSGRYIEIPVYSLSYKEFLEFHNIENNQATLLSYIKFGGLPYLVNLELEDEIVYGYLKNIYNTIILKDVVTRYNIRDVDFLDRLVEYISDSMGSYVSSKKITDFLKSQRTSLSVNTVQNYLSYLSNSFFIDKVPRFDIQGRKIFEVNDKFYFRDLGLKHALIPYKPNDINKILENLVYNKLVYDGYKVYIGKMEEKEIDFVALKGDDVLYVQVTYLLTDEKVFEREFGNLLSIKDNYRKMVISTDDFAQGNYKGIEHKHILNYLSQD